MDNRENQERTTRNRCIKYVSGKRKVYKIVHDAENVEYSSSSENESAGKIIFENYLTIQIDFESKYLY